MYVVVFLQAVYRPSRRLLWLLAAGHFVNAEIVRIRIGDPDQIGGMVAEAVSLVVVAAIMQTLARAVIRHERFTRREAILRSVVTELIADRDPLAMRRIVTEGASQLVALDDTLVSVWRAEGDRLVRDALKSDTDQPKAQLGELDISALPPELHAIYVGGRPCALSSGELAMVQAMYGLPQEPKSVIVAPFGTGARPTGLLVLSSTQTLDKDLLAVIERFAYEVSLATELTERDVLLAGIVESSSDVIAVVDRDGVIRFVSPALRAVTGLDPAGFERRPVTDLLAHEDGSPVTAADLAASTPTEMLLVGGREPVAVKVTGNSLARTGRVLNFRDVSDRRRLEAEVSFRASTTRSPASPTARCSTTASPRPPPAATAADPRWRSPSPTSTTSRGSTTRSDTAPATSSHRGPERLAASLRGVDTAARLGGDECAVILDGITHPDQVDRTLARVTAALRKPVLVDGRELAVGLSIGVALDGATPDDVVRNADAAMYTVKGGGKGEVATFQPRMREDALRRVQLRSELEAAIPAGELVLYYQPVRALVSGTSSGRGARPVAALGARPRAAERLHPPGRGDRPHRPARPLGADRGVPPGCRLGRRDRDRLRPRRQPLGRAPPRPRHHRGRPARARLVRLPRDLARPRGDRDRADGRRRPGRRVLRQLKALGVRLAIDDFGTGYSSFAHLQRFPVDVLKIDRSFVADVTRGPEQAALAQAIVKLANTLGIETVAEGVEAEAQAEVLASWGCTDGQGWLWSPAVPPDAAAAFLTPRVTAPTV